MDQSGIIRVEHDRDHPYKVINTGFAVDDRLSWGARGMLVYLLSKPNDWKVIVKDLINQSPAGRDAVYGILKNLEETGYLQRIRTRRTDGTFEFTTVVFERAQPLPAYPEVVETEVAEPLPAYPEAVEPEAVEPETEKPEVYRVRRGESKNGLNKERSIKAATRVRANGQQQQQQPISTNGNIAMKQERNTATDDPEVLSHDEVVEALLAFGVRPLQAQAAAGDKKIIWTAEALSRCADDVGSSGLSKPGPALYSQYLQHHYLPPLKRPQEVPPDDNARYAEMPPLPSGQCPKCFRFLQAEWKGHCPHCEPKKFAGPGAA